MTPDQSSSRRRRLLAGLGLVAALLALSVIADPITLVLLALAAVALTGCALFSDDVPALKRFAVTNGLAMLLLAWAATERSEVMVQVTADQIEASVNGVHLAASRAGIEGPLNHVRVQVGAIEERPAAASWTFDGVPALSGVGDWLAGGMRGGISSLRVVDANDSNVVPPVEGFWLSDRVAGAPRLSGSADAWTPARTDDDSVALTSPEIFNAQYQVIAAMVRPSGSLTMTFSGDEPGTALHVEVAPDRRLFAIVAQPQGGAADTLVGGPFVYRRSVVGWLQSILRELGRVWLVALALVAAARLLAIPVRASLPPVPASANWLIVAISALVLGLISLGLSGLIAITLLDGIPHTVESIAYLFEAQV
ncbi:MAG: hypothetical protein AB7K36_10590, partial [Chloroflexota bacterium]